MDCFLGYFIFVNKGEHCVHFECLTLEVTLSSRDHLRLFMSTQILEKRKQPQPLPVWGRREEMFRLISVLIY